MPKGGRKRTAADYEREIEEAAKRMQKYPEHLKAARDSEEWLNFLVDIGIKPQILNSDNGQGFFEQVRDKVYSADIDRISGGYTPEELANRHVKIDEYQRHYVNERTGAETVKPQIVYRDSTTGRFISKSDYEARMIWA